MKKVVIIGAGPAGITAGYELLKKGNSEDKEYEVIILEESSEIGGISRTVKYKGNRMDIGGHRFFSKDDEVMKWWTDLMPVQGEKSFDDRILRRKKKLSEGGPAPDLEDRVMLVRNRVSRIYYRRKFFDYPVSLKWDTIKNLGFFTTLRAGFSYLHSTMCKLKETSLENFYINRFGRVLYSMFFEGYTEKLWGRHPSEISADWGAQRVKGLSVVAIIKDIFNKVFRKNSKSKKVETSLIEEFYYPKFGPGQLWETAAEEFEKLGGRIQKNSKVVKLHKNGDKIDYVEYEENGEIKKLEADIFISSMPLKDLIEGMSGQTSYRKISEGASEGKLEGTSEGKLEEKSEEKQEVTSEVTTDEKSEGTLAKQTICSATSEEGAVPENILEIAGGLHYRDFVTVGVLVNKLNLKNQTNIRTLNNIVPDCWIYVQDVGVKLGRIQIFNNWSPYLVKNPKKQVWIGLEYFCNEGDKFWNMSDEKCIRFAAKELVKMGVISSADEIIDAHREKVKKAYPAYFDTYSKIDEVIEYLDSIENLYCVGRNGQHRYNNMDHSMVTSFEAVKNILNGVKDRSNIWNVNTEEEYHETRTN